MTNYRYDIDFWVSQETVEKYPDLYFDLPDYGDAICSCHVTDSAPECPTGPQ